MFYSRYTKYKCKLLKAIGTYKIGTKLIAMKMPQRLTLNTWNEENWYIYDNDTCLTNHATYGNEFEVIDEKVEAVEEPKTRGKK